jgi:DNA-binding SARP family transcriptional activator
VDIAGETVHSWSSGPSRSVLQYLLLRGGKPVPRDVLMDTFWSDFEPERARNNLNVAIHTLRKALRRHSDVPIVEHVRGTYRLHPALTLDVDVDEFERQLRAGLEHERNGCLEEAVCHYQRAATLYEDDLLVDEPYAEWLTTRREHYRQRLTEALDHASTLLLRQCRFADAIHTCRRLLAIDPFDDNAFRRLLHCLDGAGQGQKAVLEYRTYAARLARDLGIRPSSATQQVIDSIEAGIH